MSDGWLNSCGHSIWDEDEYVECSLCREALALRAARTDKAEAELKRLRAALEGLRYRTDCWCEFGDNPNYRSHTKQCDAARAALSGETPPPPPPTEGKP